MAVVSQFEDTQKSGLSNNLKQKISTALLCLAGVACLSLLVVLSSGM